MNEEELKAGERYNFTLLYTGQSINNKFRFESPTGIHYILGLGDMEAVSPLSAPANGIKNAEPAPKYDPCRKFREGDIVEPCQVKGRWFGTAWKDRSGIRFTVTKDEDEEGVMWVQDPDSLHPKDVEAVFFQLVTPVEELEPYSVTADVGKHYVCDKRGMAISLYYNNSHPNAKAAAEAECARLNAEYRKEQK